MHSRARMRRCGWARRGQQLNHVAEGVVGIRPMQGERQPSTSLGYRRPVIVTETPVFTADIQALMSDER